MKRALPAIAAVIAILALFTGLALVIVLKYDVSHVMKLGDIETDSATKLLKSMFGRYPSAIEHFELQTSVATETPATVEQKLKEKSHAEKIMKQLKNVEPFLPKGSTILEVARKRLHKAGGDKEGFSMTLEETVERIAKKEMAGAVEGFDGNAASNESYMQAMEKVDVSMDELMRGGIKAQGTPIDTNPDTLRKDAFAPLVPSGTLLTVEENEMLNSSPVTAGLNRLAGRKEEPRKEGYESSALPQLQRGLDLVPNYDRGSVAITGAKESNNEKTTVIRKGIYNEINDSGRYADTSVVMGVPGPITKQELLERQKLSTMDKIKAMFTSPVKEVKPLPAPLPTKAPQLNKLDEKDLDVSVTAKVPEYNPREDEYTFVNELEESVDPVKVSVEAGTYNRERGVAGLVYACASALPPAQDIKFDSLTTSW